MRRPRAKPWERQFREKAKYYIAFVLYRDMGDERTLERVATAQNLEDAERSIIWFWLLWQKQTDWYGEIQIKRPRDFSIEDLAADLENALAAKTLIPVPAFRKAMIELFEKEYAVQVRSILADYDEVMDRVIENFGLLDIKAEYRPADERFLEALKSQTFLTSTSET